MTDKKIKIESKIKVTKLALSKKVNYNANKTLHQSNKLSGVNNRTESKNTNPE